MRSQARLSEGDAPLAESREPGSGNAWRASACAPLQCRGIPATSADAPGRLASVAHALAVPHAPDVWHGQHARVPAVAGPMATPARAAPKALSTAREHLEPVHASQPRAGAEPATRGPGRPPHVPGRLAHVAPARAAARREPGRLAARRAATRLLRPARPAPPRVRSRSCGPDALPQRWRTAAGARPAAASPVLGPRWRLERVARWGARPSP